MSDRAMSGWSRYVPAGFLAMGAIVTFLTGTPRPTPLSRPLVTTMPMEFLGKRGIDVPIGADEQRVSGVSDYLDRTFDLGASTPISLYVGYHSTQQGESRMHSPTLCLPGSGWTPYDARLVAIPLGDSTVRINRYMLLKGRHRILVYYWFQGRGRVTAGETMLRLQNFVDALLSHRDEEALVRIIVPIDSGPPTAPLGTTGLPADTVAVRFASLMIPTLQRVLPVPR